MIVYQEKLLKKSLFKYDYIEKLISKDKNGYEDNAYRIYQLITLELWMRQFID